MLTIPRPSRSLAALLLVLALLGAARGQDAQAPAAPTAPAPTAAPASPPAAPAPAATAPEAVADGAVQAWLARTPVGIAQLSSMEPDEVCEALPGLIVNPPPEPGTKVNLDDRQEQPTDDPARRTFTYSAVRPGDRLDVVEVELQRVDEGAWSVARVGYHGTSEPQGVRLWLQGPAAAWLFVAFTLLVIYGLTTPSKLRGWLREGWANVREHRRLVTGTMVLLYVMFGLGALVGSGLPQACEQAILEVVTTAVTSVGATDAYSSGNVVRAAVTTFYQNFVVVTLSVTFTLSLLFAVPAYLLSAVSYFVQGIPFGLLGDATAWQFLLILVLLVLELTAYFLVVAGGGMLLATLIRKGFAGLPQAFRKLVLTLPIAMILLLVAAWYEAFIVTGLGS